MTTTASSSPSARAVTDIPELGAKAIEFLCQRIPGFAMAPKEAACVASQMRLVHFPAGSSLFKEGDNSNTGYMLLVLEGNVSVDTGESRARPKVEISVLGPGALLGELALVDGMPRSASCTAVTAVTAAGLTSAGMQRLMELQPAVATKLALFMAQSAAERLRALSEQLQMYDQLTANMQHELDQWRAGLKRAP